MPATLVRRTKPYNAEQARFVQTAQVHPAVRALANSWASYAAVGGNVARARRAKATITEQAAEYGLPLVAEIPNDVRRAVRALGMVPADLRNGNLGVCVTRLVADGVEVEEPLPKNAPLPYEVKGRNHETVIAEGFVRDRAAAVALKRRLAPFGVTHVDLELRGELLETIA